MLLLYTINQVADKRKEIIHYLLHIGTGFYRGFSRSDVYGTRLQLQNILDIFTSDNFFHFPDIFSLVFRQLRLIDISVELKIKACSYYLDCSVQLLVVCLYAHLLLLEDELQSDCCHGSGYKVYGHLNKLYLVFGGELKNIEHFDMVKPNNLSLSEKAKIIEYKA